MREEVWIIIVNPFKSDDPVDVDDGRNWEQFFLYSAIFPQIRGLHAVGIGHFNVNWQSWAQKRYSWNDKFVFISQFAKCEIMSQFCHWKSSLKPF